MLFVLLTFTSLLSAATLEDVTANTSRHFEPNLGQFESRVQFAARGPNLSILLTPGETVLVRADAEPVRMSLNGGRASKLEAVDRLPGVSNYYWGPDPKMWRERVPHYARVRARQVYEGIDIVYYSNGKRLEYDFVVAPGADPSRIELAFDGAGRIELSREGDLVLVAKSGEVRQRKPVVYQEVSGRRVEVAGRYRIREGRVGFELGEYEASKQLVIDPILEYGTYFGGAGGTSFPTAIATDASGAIVVAGTSNAAIPLLNPVDTGGARGSFVAPLQPGGNSLAFSTFLPGTVTGIAVNNAGHVFVVGYILTGNFPVRNAIQPLPRATTTDSWRG